MSEEFDRRVVVARKCGGSEATVSTGDEVSRSQRYPGGARRGEEAEHSNCCHQRLRPSTSSHLRLPDALICSVVLAWSKSDYGERKPNPPRCQHRGSSIAPW